MTTPPVASITDELLAELEQLAGKSEAAGEDWVSYADLAGTLANQCDIDYIVEASPATILALLQHVRELRVDAERYRFLRSKYTKPGFLSCDSSKAKYLDEYMVCGLAMDERFDTAMQK